ncbi:universal stress protein [Methylobacterium sp. SyP6R]|uniref:universal stress protein n=1 Tax=Methylobacterium sp. SyP6R TaxID=2718876 RepID=UPI001F2F0AB2|nr:universal stress protein [Methylobacterium sp. SyP6R]MCF4129862.1 universal stress protein [Methylobacterium sp. SyP6R]
MIKDLTIVVDGVGRRAAPYGIRLAAQFEACISAVSVLPLVPFQTFAQAEIRYDLVVAAEQDAREQADAAVAAVAAAAQAAGLSCETSAICTSAPLAPRRLAEFVHLSDLAVIEQADDTAPKPADAYLDDLLFQGARPVLVVPYIHEAPPRLACAVVAWDGSAPAARALSDAIPILRRTARVELVGVTDEPVPEATRWRAIRHLARHGIEATVHTIPGGVPVAEALLSHCADRGADLLVMGAYGHSRLREAILGGTSRTILASMTVPVLMSR